MSEQMKAKLRQQADAGADTDEGPVSNEAAANNTDGRHGGATMVDVWDPATGDKHTVNNLNAADLVAHLGWHRSKPVVIRTKGTAAPTVTAGASKKPALQEVPAKADEGPVDLTALSREGLIRFAKEKFNIDANPNASNTDIIEEIEAEMELNATA